MKEFSYYAAFMGLIGLCQCGTFNREYVGVAFSPYLDPGPVANRRLWNGYKEPAITAQLTQVRNQFSSISTYSMGTAGYNEGKPWHEADSNAIVARVASKMNKANPEKPKFRVNIGIHQDEPRPRAINNAFLAADDANSRSPKTVWGITFTNEYIHDASQGQQVLDMINNNKQKAHNKGLKVGTRTERCDVIFQTGALHDIMVKIVKNSGFIYCNLYPSGADASLGPAQAAHNVGEFYKVVRTAMRQLNPSIEVIIGETGWPSQGQTPNGSKNNVANLVAYWKAMNNWAANNHVKVQMFEAFDEPWKADNGNVAEGHFGKWYQPKSKVNQYNLKG